MVKEVIKKIRRKLLKRPVEHPAFKKAAELAYQHDVAKGRQVIEQLLSCPLEQLTDRDFLLRAVCTFGIGHNDWPELREYRQVVNASSFGVVQIPSELVDYLLLLSSYKPATYLEVGTAYGGTAVVTAAYLSRFNPSFHLTAVDIENHFKDYDYYAARLPLSLACPATSADFMGQEWDVAFIDADHSYHGVMRDYLQVGRFARICAFHDINGHEFDHLAGGTVRLWGEVKTYVRKTHGLVEISHASNPNWMGIGVVIRPDVLARRAA